MQHIWSVLCRKSIIDSETNLLSMLDSFEELTVDLAKNYKGESINIPLEFELVSYWVTEKQEGPESQKVLIELKNPQNEVIKKFDQLIKLKKNNQRLRACLRIKGIGLTGEGKYVIQVKHKGEKSKNYKKVSEIPFYVKFNYQK
ncbi:hypothetical protein ACFL16_00140 [Patescibacteria group bacterium]